MVIATVFLTIIGLTAGFMLGERRNNATGGSDSGQTTDAGGSTDAAQPDAPSTGDKSCPPESIKTAAKLGLPVDLRQTMKVVTDKGTIVWICTDGEGKYYYQSQTATDDGQLIQGRNGLFLTDVEQLDSDHYVARDHEGTRFEVTASRFQIDFLNKKPQIDRVATVE